MRGYLRNPRHLYMLDADVTSIGKKQYKDLQPPAKYRKAEFHIPLSSSNTDAYHATVERKHVQNCFVLTDLNTTYGTYVNGHHVQNKAIRLIPGDIIRFGHDSSSYEFGITNEFETKHPVRTLTGRGKIAIETGTLEDLQQKRWTTPQSSSISLSGVKFSSRPGSAPTRSLNNISRSSSTPVSLLLRRRIRSVPIRLRPVSAESLGVNCSCLRQTKSLMQPVKTNNGNESGKLRKASKDRDRGTSAKRVYFKNNVETNEDEPWFVTLLREKEEALLHMEDDIERLQVAERENKRKKILIDELEQKLHKMNDNMEELQHKQNIENVTEELRDMTNTIQSLSVYESESKKKDKEVAKMRNEVARLQIEKQIFMQELNTAEATSAIPYGSQTSESSFDNRAKRDVIFQDQSKNTDASVDTGNEWNYKPTKLLSKKYKTPQEVIIGLALEVQEKDEVIDDIKNELQKVNYEHKLTKNFLETLQGGVEKGQKKIGQIQKALENAKLQKAEAEANIERISKRFSTIKEEIRHWEIEEIMEYEIQEEHKRLQLMQLQLLKQEEKFEKQTRELRKTNKYSKQKYETEKASAGEVTTLQEKIRVLKKDDLQCRIKSKQNLSRLEKFRSHVIQQIYSTTGAIRPDIKLDDEHIVQLVQKLATDRNNFYQILLEHPASPTPGGGNDDQSDTDGSSSSTSTSDKKGKKKRKRKK